MPDTDDLDDDVRSGFAQLAEKLATDPATRKDFLRLAKKSNPNMSIPEVDMDDHMQSVLKPYKEHIDSLEGKIREKEITDRIESTRRKLVEDGVASREDLPEIEKLMVDKKIPDHRTAAEFYRLQKEAAKPTPGVYKPNTPPVDFKTIGSNPTTWSRNEAVKAIDELMRTRTH